MIRMATLEDVPALVELGRLLCTESPVYTRLHYNGERVAAFIRELIMSPRGFAWVGEQDGVVVAVFLAAPQAHWACDALIATELVLYVRPESRGSSIAARLVAEFITWAKSIGAEIAAAGSTTGVNEELTVRLYERFGFQRIGTNLELELWVSGEQ
jgi:GNAT superfamily N-acetyltransferase